MNFFTFTKLDRMLLLAVVLVVGVVCLSGCGGGSGSGSFTDKRDGQKYRTVKIGDQVWMAENLSYKFGDSRCYDDDNSNCLKYGRLYDWNMAKIACPKGWHLPSRDEWTKLVTIVGSATSGEKMKSTNGWDDFCPKFPGEKIPCRNGNGTDDYGFCALPGGGHFTTGGFGVIIDEFDEIGQGGYWWTDTEESDYYAYYRYIHSAGNSDESEREKSHAFSVRCVAD